MIVAEIKTAPKHLCLVCFDNGEELLVDRSVAEENLHKGLELQRNQLEEIIGLSDYRRAMSRAMWHIEQGDISEKRLREKLKKAGFGTDAVQKTVLRLSELGLINDEDYACRLAERLLESLVSKREAQQKMIQRGIAKDVAVQALDMFECDPLLQIKALINKKYKNKLTDHQAVEKVFAALMRKGFNYRDIKSVLVKYDEELSYKEDENE